MMKHIIISNHPTIWEFCNINEIDYLMIDLEQKDKFSRQSHKNTWISNHSIEDIRFAKAKLNSTKLIVRINSIHESSKEEIDLILKFKPDLIMLPFFSSFKEVEDFMKIINDRVDVAFLFETLKSLTMIQIITDRFRPKFNYLGLNDLSITMKIGFLFLILQTRLINYFSDINVQKKIDFGFGGIGYEDNSLISPSLIYAKHIEFQSNHVILSRNFIRDIDLDANVSLEILQSRYDQLIGIEQKLNKLSQSKLYELSSSFDTRLEEIIKSDKI